MLLYPGAYVDVEDMSHVEPLCKLRVYCAGVWHNFMLSIMLFINKGHGNTLAPQVDL